MSTSNKRIKRVFSNADQVLHLWANQSQADARCRNAYFEGTKAYSYGSHYLLAELIKHKGQTVALINNYKYSPTTNGHISSAHHAASHLIAISTSRDEWSVKGGLSLRKAALLAEMESHFKRMKFWGPQRWADKYSLRQDITEFNKLCDAVKEKSFKIKVSTAYIQKYNEHIKARLKRQKELESPEAEAKRQLARQKRELNAVKKAAGEIQAWRDGGLLTNSVRNLYPQIIRVKDGEVQTSKNASVPLNEALALLNKVQRNKAKQGDKVGSFVYNSNDGETVRISCHTIALSEAIAVLQNHNLKLVAN
jgi:hypothetical protein